MVLKEFTNGRTVPLDYRGRPIRTGDYVLILLTPDYPCAPGYPCVAPGHLGRVTGREWHDKDGTINVVVVGSPFKEHRGGNMSTGRMNTCYVNLNFGSAYLRTVSEALIESGRMPGTICVEFYKAAYEIELDPETLRSQHERLKSFGRLEESVLKEPVGVA